MESVRQIVLCIAHGTVEDLADLPAFVTAIRHGRPPPPELLVELEQRYNRVGGSPLLRETERQADALGRALSLETRVAMRLWRPRVSDVISDLGPEDQVLLVPLAPYSVAVYEAAARRELSALTAPPELRCISPYGESPSLVRAHAEGIKKTLAQHRGPAPRVIVSAHSLPLSVIERGDDYEKRFIASVRLLEQHLGFQLTACFQSQGADGGRWLGPTLYETMKQAQADGFENVLVSPIGFLSEHIETLYDLDIEAREQALALGLGFTRVPALGVSPLLTATLEEAVAPLLLR